MLRHVQAAYAMPMGFVRPMKLVLPRGRALRVGRMRPVSVTEETE